MIKTKSNLIIYKDNIEVMIMNITTFAAEKAKQILALKGKEGWGFRLFIAEGG